MARLPRLVVPGLAHLIVHRGHNDEAAFLDDADRETYLRVLGTSAVDAAVKLHAYGLLPSEVRFLVTPSTEGGLAAMMQAIGRRYVRAFNLRHGRRSSPWEGRFRSTVIEPGPDVLTSLLVIETLASAGAGFASGSEVPAWTSAAHHLGARRDALISEHPLFWTLGNTPFEREAAYRQRVHQGISAADAGRILGAAIGGWALASKEFASHLSDQTGRRAQALPRGRPPAAARMAKADDVSP